MMTTTLIGPTGTVTTDADTLGMVIAALADEGRLVYAVTSLGKCGSVGSEPCNCLRCEYGHVTTLDYYLPAKGSDGNVYTLVTAYAYAR